MWGIGDEANAPPLSLSPSLPRLRFCKIEPRRRHLNTKSHFLRQPRPQRIICRSMKIWPESRRRREGAEERGLMFAFELGMEGGGWEVKPESPPFMGAIRGEYPPLPPRFLKLCIPFPTIRLQLFISIQ